MKSLATRKKEKFIFQGDEISASRYKKSIKRVKTECCKHFYPFFSSVDELNEKFADFFHVTNKNNSSSSGSAKMSNILTSRDAEIHEKVVTRRGTNYR